MKRTSDVVSNSRTWLKISGGFLLFLSCCAVLAPFITTHSYELQNIDQILSKPNSEYWFGTDSLGRDLYSRIVYGARVSLMVAAFTSVVAMGIGTFVGVISGYFGGWVDRIIMRMLDVMQAVPALVMMILISTIFHSLKVFEYDNFRSIAGILFALSLVGWVSVARLVRGQVLQVRELSFVESARAAGASHFRILKKHILPQIVGPVLVLLTYQVPSHVLAESFLSFIGLGLQPPFSSWGVLANEGWRSFRSYPHLIIFPGMVLFLTMMALQILGDSLRDVIDPRIKRTYE